MLPVSHVESQQEAAQRQANFILLRSLESKIPQTLFQQVLETVSIMALTLQVSTQIELPKRTDWKGEQRNLTFDELKTNFSHIDQNFLPELLRQTVNGSNLEFRKINQNEQPGLVDSKKLRTSLLTGKCQNVLSALKSIKNGNLEKYQKLNLKNYEISRFERMKTVFGHFQLDEGYSSSIYNVQFDKSGKFIVSGADDGIIKIWDKDTMGLQASLYGHKDFITDIDISKCNRYIASSSKDGVIIIWDLQKCSLIEKINAHTGPVNNIRFFEFKLKKDSPSGRTPGSSIQFLVSCSEDGTIKIFDESGFLFNQNSQTEESKAPQAQTLRNRRKTEQLAPKKERFFISLTPEDFRPGSRNHKIESVNINSSGLVAAGTNYGEIYMWKIDFSQFKTKQISKISHWIGSFKRHTKIVHFCEYSPDGKYLFTGSIDGTAKIWDMKSSYKAKKEQFELGEDKLIVTLEEKRTSSQCDCLIWSVNGRYAITSISSKMEGEKNIDISFIKVWDSETRHVIQDLTKGNNLQLQNFSFVLAPHPKIEEILLTGSDGGLLALWNIKTRQLIKRFIEYGVYSIDCYTLNDPFDGKFSPDGSSFVVGSMLGTISLYSCDGANHKYEQTRVQQFFPDDGKMNDINVYQYADEEPQLCNQVMIPHEHQPPSALIGKFKNSRILTNEEYEKTLLFRKTMCQEEEDFIKDQLEEGLRNDFFNANEAGVNAQEIIISEIDDVEEEVNIRPGHQNRYRDPDNDLYDRESDDNFELEDEQASEDEEASYGQEASEEFKGQRENYHQAQQSRRFQRTREVEEEEEEEEEKQVQMQSGRYERLQRRQQRTQNDDDEDEDSGVKTRNRKSKRRQINDDEDADMEDYEFSDIEPSSKNKKRRLKKTQSENNVDLPSSNEESLQSNFSSAEDEFQSNSRSKRSKMQKGKSQKQIDRHTRNAGRKNRVRYDNMDESYGEEDDDQEEMKQDKVTRSNKRRIIEEESEKEEVEDVVMIDTSVKVSKQKGDSDYVLVPIQKGEIKNDEGVVEQLISSELCTFCRRLQDPLLELIGPFVKYGKNQEIVDGPLFFHQECLETNQFSYFCIKSQSYLNIGKALDQLVHKRQYKCERCHTKGATIKCNSCNKHYHGYFCSILYMICLDQQNFQCFECRNLYNHQTSSAVERQEYSQLCKSIPREMFIQPDHIQEKTFIPQMNDLIYYFFQGHERFIQEYNCFFYCGDNDKISFTYPWRTYPELLQPSLCKIVNIHYRFPTNKAMYLLKRFGKQSSSFYQSPQIIMQLELEIVRSPNKRFMLDIFKNEMPDFLILKHIFEKNFQFFMQQENIIGKIFDTKIKTINKVKVCGIIAKEPTLFPQSPWESIIYQQQEAYRLRERGGRRGQRRPEEEEKENPKGQMNSWELKFEDYDEEELKCAFDENENLRLQNVINDYISKKKDKVVPFKSRVTEKIATDYRCHVPVEMYLDLIIERLQSKFYRTQEQLFNDLDLISYNARIYNGDDHEFARSSKKVVEHLRCELRKNINSVGDRKNQKEEVKQFDWSQPIKPVGKLTAPNRLTGGVSSFDVFSQRQQEEDHKRNKQEEEKKVLKKEKRQVNHDDEEEDELFEDNLNEQDSIVSDAKITPVHSACKNGETTMNGNGRRPLRNQQRKNYSESSHDHIMNGTGEKLSRKREEAPQQEGVLGKRPLRSCKQRGIEDDEEEEEHYQSKQQNGREAAHAEQQRKRIRN